MFNLSLFATNLKRIYETNNTPRDIAQNITTFFNVWYEALSGWFFYNQLYKYIEILLIETDAP